jgi:hypothetical protein
VNFSSVETWHASSQSHYKSWRFNSIHYSFILLFLLFFIPLFILIRSVFSLFCHIFLLSLFLFFDLESLVPSLIYAFKKKNRFYTFLSYFLQISLQKFSIRTNIKILKYIRNYGSRKKNIHNKKKRKIKNFFFRSYNLLFYNNSL